MAYPGFDSKEQVEAQIEALEAEKGAVAAHGRNKAARTKEIDAELGKLKKLVAPAAKKPAAKKGD